MLKPGTLTAAGEWVEPTSLARSIETELAADKLIDLDDESEEAMLLRRKSMIAMARGIINYLKTNLDITIEAGALRNTGETGAQLPAAAKTYTVSGGQVSIAAGGLRAASETGLKVPLSTKVLSGRVS